MSEYNHNQVKAVGARLVDLAYALSDGLDISDSDEGVALLTAFMNAADEFQGDLDAAVLDLLSGAADAWARARQNVEYVE